MTKTPKDKISVELTEEEKLRLEEEARQEVEEEAREEKKRVFKEAARSRMKRRQLFSEGKDDDGDDLEEVTLDLAPMQSDIRLDGKSYYHGRKYKVKKSIAAVLRDQMYRGWDQEAARTKEKPDALRNKQKYLGSRGMTVG